jgi:acyl dehydratase
MSTMNYNCLPKIREQTMGINYGFDKIRFISPVKSGARIRGHFTLSDARFRGAGMMMTSYDVSIEIEHEKKPALTATWTTIIQFDPKDRPEDH